MLRCGFNGGIFQMSEHKRKDVVHRVLAVDAIDVSVARNDVAGVQLIAVGLPQEVVSNLGAFGKETLIVGAMDEFNRNRQPVQVWQVSLRALIVDQMSLPREQRNVFERADIGNAEQLVQGVV